MITIREFSKDDLDQIQKIDFFLWLCLRWNRSYHEEDTFVAVDNQEILGIMTYAWESSWYYLNKESVSLPEYCMKLEVVVKDENIAVRRMLLQKAKEHFKLYQEKYSDKKVILRGWCMEGNGKHMEDYLSCGYAANSITMVLSYDLTKPLPEKKEINDITISIHECDKAGIASYLKANEAGYDGVQDSADEFCFTIKGEGTKVFTAQKDGEVLSSCMVWKITDTHYATENVFTVPKYRQMGIGTETIFTALRYQKEQGIEESTLTVRGNNLPAIHMYLSMGFHFKENMYGMCIG